jgi:uncharacterized YigZ family protein
MIHMYKTVKQPGMKEIVIKKSRFIGHARPVESEEEALRFIEEIRKQHWSATHNCFAYVVGERSETQKQSDDGEPSGTAGKPILEVIKNRELQNVAVVVTRYFGGIKLGAGGLIRAYTDGAAAAIEAAEPVYRVLHREVTVEVDYSWLGKLENELRNRGVMLKPTQFTDKVTIPCLPLAADAEQFIAWLTNLTQGRGKITVGEDQYVTHSAPPFAT